MPHGMRFAILRLAFRSTVENTYINTTSSAKSSLKLAPAAAELVNGY